MPQSLLALLAILAVSVLLLQSTRDRTDDLADSYQSDAEVQSRGVAVGVLERLSGYTFDGGEGADLSASGLGRYSPAASFGVAVDASGTALEDLFSNGSFDDLDDFNGVEGAVATVDVFDPTSGAVSPLSFDVAISVAYAQQSGNDWQPVTSSTTRSHSKWAVVSVDHPSFHSPVRLGRIYVSD